MIRLISVALGIFAMAATAQVALAQDANTATTEQIFSDQERDRIRAEALAAILQYPEIIEEALEILLGQLNRMDAILVQLFQRFLVLLVKDLPNIAVAAREDPPLPSLIELPLLNVLGDVLPVRPQGIPDINGYVIAVKIQ